MDFFENKIPRKRIYLIVTLVVVLATALVSLAGVIAKHHGWGKEFWGWESPNNKYVAGNYTLKTLMSTLDSEFNLAENSNRNLPSCSGSILACGMSDQYSVNPSTFARNHGYRKELHSLERFSKASNLIGNSTSLVSATPGSAFSPIPFIGGPIFNPFTLPFVGGAPFVFHGGDGGDGGGNPPGNNNTHSPENENPNSPNEEFAFLPDDNKGWQSPEGNENPLDQPIEEWISHDCDPEVHAVPEISTALMILMGLCFIGFYHKKFRYSL